MHRFLVAVAQVVRASGCGPEGRGFESPRSPQSQPGWRRSRSLPWRSRAPEDRRASRRPGLCTRSGYRAPGRIAARGPGRGSAKAAWRGEAGARTLAPPVRASSSMAEQRTLNPQVLGSNPRGRTTSEQASIASGGCLRGPRPTNAQRNLGRGIGFGRGEQNVNGVGPGHAGRGPTRRTKNNGIWLRRSSLAEAAWFENHRNDSTASPQANAPTASCAAPTPPQWRRRPAAHLAPPRRSELVATVTGLWPYLWPCHLWIT